MSVGRLSRKEAPFIGYSANGIGDLVSRLGRQPTLRILRVDTRHPTGDWGGRVRLSVRGTAEDLTKKGMS